MGMIPYATVASYVRRTVLNPALNYQLNLMEPMYKLIEFTCIERIWDNRIDDYHDIEHKLELPYPNTLGFNLDALIAEWKEYGNKGYFYQSEDYFKEEFTYMYPDRKEDIQDFYEQLEDDLSNLSWAVTGYEERDDMLTLIKPYTKPQRKDGGIYLSCRRSAKVYDVASNGTVTIQSHIVSETYTRYKLNFDFTWSYEGEPYEEHIRYTDGDFKSHFNVT